MTPGELGAMTEGEFDDCLREGISRTFKPLLAMPHTSATDPTGQAAHACGRGLTIPMAVRRGVRPDDALTVREALEALRTTARQAIVDLQLFESGRSHFLELDRSALIAELEAREDHDDSTRLYLSPQGHLVTLRPEF